MGQDDYPFIVFFLLKYAKKVFVLGSSSLHLEWLLARSLSGFFVEVADLHELGMAFRACELQQLRSQLSLGLGS